MLLTIVSHCRAGAIAKLAEQTGKVAKISFRPIVIAGAATSAVTLAGCAQDPGQHIAHSKEYFPSSIYGPASPKVVADGEPVPRGGGTYLVGKPYTIAGKTYYPSEKQYAAVGSASWYGDAFHGRRTANGEIFDRDSISAAHPTMPLPSYARVTNLRNNYSIIVRVNDRGPYSPGRIMDVSRRVAEVLEFRHLGTTKVKVEYLGAASLAGSDDAKLIATLRFDGAPAQLDKSRPPTLVAQSPNAQPAYVNSATPPQPTAREEVAAAAPLPVERLSDDSSPLPPTRLSDISAPLPPARPFDLGTIPGAAVPIGQRQASTGR
jgi:rare lipoprotein A